MMKAFFGLLLIHQALLNVVSTQAIVVDPLAQEALSRAVNETIAHREWRVSGFPASLLPSLRSSMRDACHSLHDWPGDFPRVGCCHPQDVRHLHNVKIEDGSFIFFGTAKFTQLPEIRSFAKHGDAPETFQMEIKRRPSERFGGSQCTSVFDGTLHIFSRSLAHNVYHATVDNFLPLVSQVVLDAYLSSPLLHRPRLFLAPLGLTLAGAPARADSILQAGRPHSKGVPRASTGGPEPSPHMELVRSLFSAGHASLRDLEGVCFRRVVWGGGIRALYHNSLVAMRRAVTDFAHSFVKHRFGLRVPPSRSLPPPAVQLASNTTASAVAGLRVTVFTRSSLSGSGFTGTSDSRALTNEAALISAFNARGAFAVLCCDFSLPGSFLEQLSLAAHSDVLIGVHGAALVHGVFAPRGLKLVEIKIHYGFESSLFALVADSRVGVHFHVDARSYNPAGGARGNLPVDEKLVETVLEMVSTPSDGPNKPKRGALPVARLRAAPWSGDLGLVLGPAANQVLKVCRAMELARYQAAIGSSEALHCAAACKQYRDSDDDSKRA